MKLVELLDEAIKIGSILYNKDTEISIRYCEDIDSFAKCKLDSGEFILKKNKATGYRKIFLNGKLLESKNWISIKYPIRIGDNFFLGYVSKKIRDDIGNIITLSYRHDAIGQVVHIHVDDNGENIGYELKIDDAFGYVLLSKEALLKYPRVYDN